MCTLFQHKHTCLALKLLIPLILIGPAIYIWMMSPYDIYPDPDNWLPEYLGELQCNFTEHRFWTPENETRETVDIIGMTINNTNSTLCANKPLSYGGCLGGTWILDLNATQFRDYIIEKFPAGKIINCSVSPDCTQFAPFKEFNYIRLANEGGVFLFILVSASTPVLGAVLVLGIIELIYVLRKRHSSTTPQSKIQLISRVV